MRDDIKLNDAQLLALRDTKLGRRADIGVREELRDLGLIQRLPSGWLLTQAGKQYLIRHGTRMF